MQGNVASIGVVIVTWNSGRYLKRCLQALSSQTRKPDRILVVDNNSRDDTLSVAALFPRVETVAMKENLGFAAANNLAVKSFLDTEWVVLLNADAYAEKQWLAALETAALDYPGHDGFGSRMLSFENPSVLDGVGDCYHVSGMAWRKGHGRKAAGRYTTSADIFSPCAAAAMYRRESFLALGGFDEDLFCYFEDVDLGFRMNLAGYKCRYVPEAVVSHVGSGSLGEYSDFALYHGHRNLIWCFLANMPSFLFWMFLPVHILFNLVSICYRTWQGHGRIMLKAETDAWGAMGKSLKKRKTRASHHSSIKRLLSMLEIDPFGRCW